MRTLNDTFYIKPGFAFSLAVAIYTVPLRLLGNWFAAIVIHEVSHMLAIKMMGIKIKQVGFGFNGALIETESMKPWQEMFSAMAGPVGGSLPILLGRYLPCLSLCALIQTVYNLLPMHPLDGGRALQCFICIAFGENKGKRIFCCVETVTLILLALCFLYFCYMFFDGVMGTVILVLSSVRLYQLKFPCKRQRKIVQ